MSARPGSQFVLYTFLFLTACISTQLTWAQGQNDEWKFRLAPYLMGASMDGTATIRDRDVDVDVSISDIFGNMKFGFMGYFEARKGPWGFASDTAYVALGSFSEFPAVNVDINQLTWNFWGIREINPWADLVFGARWTRIQGELDFKNLNRQFGDTRNWVDPIVGVRLSSDQSKRIHAAVLADIGGFGLASDLTWEVFPTVGINLGQYATVGFGYRWLSVDYQTGEGDQRFGYDVVTQGPAIGLAFNF